VNTRSRARGPPGSGGLPRGSCWRLNAGPRSQRSDLSQGARVFPEVPVKSVSELVNATLPFLSMALNSQEIKPRSRTAGNVGTLKCAKRNDPTELSWRGP